MTVHCPLEEKNIYQIQRLISLIAIFLVSLNNVNNQCVSAFDIFPTSPLLDSLKPALPDMRLVSVNTQFVLKLPSTAICMATNALNVGNTVLEKMSQGQIPIDLDPDANRDVIQLIESRGFKAETHYVTTKDGYILTVNRIRNPYIAKPKRKRVVILQHGLVGSSRNFVVNSPGEDVTKKDTADICDNQSQILSNSLGNNLGFVLSKLGLDVWMPNTRGSGYSQNHTKLSTSDPDFWKFTYDEMVKYDLPAYIDYILNVTNEKTLSYIGFSQGGFLGLGLLSTQPEYAKVILPYIGLAPAYAKPGSESLLGLFQLLTISTVDILKSVPGPMVPGWIHKPFVNACLGLGAAVCVNLFAAGAGCNARQANASRYHVYVQNYPSQTSTWNLGHYFQQDASKSQKMDMFDLGPVGNMQKYGQAKPPSYDFGRITSKYIAILHGANDALVTPETIALLKKALKVPLLEDYQIADPKFTHVDFEFAKEAGKLVYTKVVKILQRVLC